MSCTISEHDSCSPHVGMVSFEFLDNNNHTWLGGVLSHRNFCIPHHRLVDLRNAMMPQDTHKFSSEAATDTQKWHDIATSNPSRVVQVLSLGPSRRRTRWGDTIKDEASAVAAVSAAAMAGGSVWHQLVKHGIAERLCLRVVEIDRPSVTAKLSEARMSNAKPSCGTSQPSYFSSLYALSHASVRISQPPKSVDHQLLKTLKAFWSKMMARIWQDPANSLKKEDSYVSERLVVPQILFRLLVADASFMRIVDNDSDLTVPVLVRYFIYATQSHDTRLAAVMLTEMMCPKIPELQRYRKAHPIPSSVSARIVKGAGSPEKLLVKSASHLANADNDDFATELVMFIVNLYDIFRAQNSAWLATFRQTSTLWSNLFLHLRKVAKRKSELRTVLPILNIIGDTLQSLNSVQDADAIEAIISLWVRTDLFGALDLVLPETVDVPGVTVQVATILACIQEAFKRRPSVVGMLRSEFPRPRMLRALLERLDDHQRNKTGDNFADSLHSDLAISADVMLPLDHIIWTESAAKLLLDLHAIYKGEGLICARRVCNKTAVECCTQCNANLYCGEDCRKKDWKEHKNMCGHEVDASLKALQDGSLLLSADVRQFGPLA